MTFREELEKMLRDLHGYEVPLTGEVTLDADLDYENKLVTREIETAITSIINLVDKEIPKKKANALKPGGIVLSEDGKTVAISNLTSASSGGYNQAIDDMRAIIRSKE